ncbi:unnamed protein product [Effrenium voratum]|uniref:Pre-rRNA-processing protein TSR2 n=1 Tax=Effrenium voratum TaxID=2562239 RepID=A0AA36MJC9_9DINO|nr:unnamed protein product [Effrenium voratum]CAJ1421157.1 unnamed protein product [Effrenium voratum]
MEQKFHEAVDRVFERWTTLALATDQGWGGRDSFAKARQLQAEVVEYLSTTSRKKRPPSWENPSDVEELSRHLYQRIDELFNTETDDGSDAEVAMLCLRLFNTCQRGDSSFADQVLQATVGKQDLAQSQGSERIEYATEEDELLDKLDGMDIDEGEEGDSDGEQGMPQPEAAPAASPPAAGYKQVIEPTVDEDGFTSVVKGHRRPR